MPVTFAFPFTLRLRLPRSSITSSACVFPHPFISLPLTPSFPSLHKTNNSYLSRCVSVCHLHFQASYWEQLWPLDQRGLFMLVASDQTQSSNKLWRFDAQCVEACPQGKMRVISPTALPMMRHDEVTSGQWFIYFVLWSKYNWEGFWVFLNRFCCENSDLKTEISHDWIWNPIHRICQV